MFIGIEFRRKKTYHPIMAKFYLFNVKEMKKHLVGIISPKYNIYVITVISCLSLVHFTVFSQSVPRNIKTQEYRSLQEKRTTGWNTWYSHSVMSHVLLFEILSKHQKLKNDLNQFPLDCDLMMERIQAYL